MRLHDIVILEQQIFTIIKVSFFIGQKKKKEKKLGLTTNKNKFIMKML